MYLRSNCGILVWRKRAGPVSTGPEEARPMSVGEVIALLMLVIAAIKLGHDLKKQPPPEKSKEAAFSQAINLLEIDR